ncbi:MAG: glycerol kinase GlpK [bacterium]
MMSKYILALDQGTTSSRAILFDRSGNIKSSAQQEFKQVFPRPGWVEHDAEEIWQTQMNVAAQAIWTANITAKEIAAIGLTNQRETTVLWDRTTGEPIHHAIVWQDRRTAGFCDQLKEEGLAAEFQKKTGLVIDAYFSATKIKWLLDNVDGARQKAEAGEIAFGTIDSWLVWKFSLGKRHVTDISNASRTMLYNIRECRWDDEILGLLNIPKSILPEVCSCSEVYAETGAGLFDAPLPIAGMAGDQQAALFGQMCTMPGMLKNTYGTGCFMMLNTGAQPIESANNLLTTIAWQLDDAVTYALEGSVFVAGAVVQWLRDGLGLIKTSAEIEKLARSVADNGGVYFVPAFVGLGAPHWDPFARGSLLGLTRGTTAGHIARAALESIAFQTRDVLIAMKADSGIDIQELRVDGGATVNDMLMQFQADILGVPVVRPTISETTALGSGYLAGLAVGFWQNREEIQKQWQKNQTFSPEMDRAQVDEMTARWQEALQRAKGWERG